MKSEHSDKPEDCYEIEYTFLKQIHFRDGEILKLEYINAKHCREIERLQNEKDKTVGELLSRIDGIKFKCHNDAKTLINRISELQFELNIRNVPAMKESLKDGARLALQQDDEIERLNARISTILETNPDMKCIEVVCRDCLSILLDNSSLLDVDETTKIKIQFAEHILRTFGITNIHGYENIHNCGEIDFEFIDHRNKNKEGSSKYVGDKEC